MRKVEVDPTARMATIQGGATAENLVREASAYDFVAVTGIAGSVGMTGLTLGGGYGPLTPRYGLALDNLLAAEVVLRDGRCVEANASKNIDLFWALRGGGGNFGVVTSMQIRLYRAENPLSGVIVFPWAEAERVLHGYARLMKSAPDELAVTAGISFGPDGAPALFLTPTWSGERSRGELFITRLQRLGNPVSSTVGPMSCESMLQMADSRFNKIRRFATRTRWVAAITPEVIAAIIAAGNSSPSSLSMITVQSFHGAPTRVPLESTAFGLRERHFMVLIVPAWQEDAADGGSHPREWARALSEALAPNALPGGYVNLLAHDDYDQIASAFGSNAARLRRIKNQFDPNGMFLSAVPLPT